MECPLWRLLILSRSVNKHGYHRNLVGSIYGISSMKIAHFVPIGQQTWPPHTILVSDWSISKKSSSLKLLSHMNRNLVESIYMYGRLCIKFPQRMKGERHWASSCMFILSFYWKFNMSFVSNPRKLGCTNLSYFTVFNWLLFSAYYFYLYFLARTTTWLY